MGKVYPNKASFYLFLSAMEAYNECTAALHHIFGDQIGPFFIKDYWVGCCGCVQQIKKETRSICEKAEILSGDTDP